jgi:signal transduction histidine kinase
LFDPLIETVSLIEKDIIRKNQDIYEFKLNASRLAHQFLLPIQSIVANAENLYSELEKTKLKDEYKILTKDILDEITKLAFIADSIRAQLASGQIRSNYLFDKVEFMPIIMDVIKLFRREAETKNVLIMDPVIQEDLPTFVIEASKPHIEIVIFNIYHNAVKYSYYSGKDSQRYIYTNISSYKNYIRFEVSNYGVGILQEELEKELIFAEGYRGVLSRDKWRTGSGIGLGVVRAIVDAHSGNIKITSVNAGTGRESDPHKTTAIIDLPILQKKR